MLGIGVEARRGGRRALRGQGRGEGGEAWRGQRSHAGGGGMPVTPPGAPPVASTLGNGLNSEVPAGTTR